MFSCFDELFSKRLQKAAQFVKKHKKSWICSKLCNFSSRLPCLCISMNFSGKSCKKCLISWESTKHNRFGENLELFEQTAMFWHFHELFSIKLQKVPHFVKKHEKSSIWQKLSNFFNKLPCFWILMNFWGKGWKKWFISWKSTKNHGFGQNLQLFEQTVMFLHFDELLRKRLEKVVYFEKKHENSCIFWKHDTFRKNYHVLTFRWTFQQKVAKTASFREKPGKTIDLAKTMQLFLTNYHGLGVGLTLTLTLTVTHVSTFWGAFWQRVAKSASFREKAQNIVDLFKNFFFFKENTMFYIFGEFFSKKLETVPYFAKSTKNRRFGQKLQNFRTNYHVSAFWRTFQQKVAKPPSFREKARKIVNLARNTKHLDQTTIFWRFSELFGKKLQRVPDFVKKHEKSSI